MFPPPRRFDGEGPPSGEAAGGVGFRSGAAPAAVSAVGRFCVRALFPLPCSRRMIRMAGSHSRRSFDENHKDIGRGCAVVLADGDYVRLIGYQDSGGALSTGDGAMRCLQNAAQVVRL